MKKLFLTGMVRSGTTLISRAFDAHPNIVCAEDPCLGFFRSLRNELVFRTYGACPDPEEPFGDLFFSPPSELEMYLNADLNIPIQFESVEITRERLYQFNLHSCSTKLVQILDKLGDEKTYAELLESILGLILEVYGKAETRCVGFVQTWVEIFVPILLNTWREALCIHIIRDPRAVIASWLKTNHLTHDYPLLMMLRHWRKSAALASLYSRLFGNNYIVLRYEDFVLDPKKVLKSICKRINLPFSSTMTNTHNFRSGSGDLWQSNTSYEMTTKGINHHFVDRWRERLSETDLQFIEDMCFLEMQRWGYSRITQSGAPASILKVPFLSMQVQQKRTEWLARYSDAYKANIINRAKELYRWFLWNYSNSDFYAEDDLKSVLIDPEGILK